MPSLNFETGLKTFTINGDDAKTLSFPPSDVGFIKNILITMDNIEQHQKEYMSNIKSFDNIEETDTNVIVDNAYKAIECIDNFDAKIRKSIDDLFSDYTEKSSKVVFGKTHTCGIVNGSPIWFDFLVAVLTECDNYYVSQETAKNPKLEKLMRKYKKK